VKETNRLKGVLDRQLALHEFVAGEYSIADMACYPWVVPHERQGQNLDDFPHVKRWFHSLAARPAVIRAYEKGEGMRKEATMTDEEKKVLFGQTAQNTQR
jgi:GST-like protein